jgi:glutathione-regulated potassium-efflux system protein KefB
LCIGIVVVAGRYLLNPFLALLASTGAREVMTAAALLVVLGAAALMQFAGMSMALGAFLAGVMLAGSNYRHELEADIEPFRGLLLALFFMGVGMSIDMGVVTARLGLIVVAAIVITLLKAAIVAALFRATCPNRGDGMRAGSVLTAASEFSFVLIPFGVSLGAMGAQEGNLFAAIAAITMLIGPPFAASATGRWRDGCGCGCPSPTTSTRSAAPPSSSGSAVSGRSCRNACSRNRSTSSPSTTTPR